MHPDRITSLDAIYTAESGPTFMTGIQALARLPLMQRRLDRRRGLNTAGLVSGYRGSPLLRSVAVHAYKLMAYKDEHEVARLYSEPAFKESLAREFVDSKRVSVWLAPPAPSMAASLA